MSLIKAMMTRDKGLVSLILESGASPNEFDEDGISAMHLAAGMPPKRGLELLQLFEEFDGNPNVRSDDGITPVHVAVMWDRFQSLRWLLAHGGDEHLRETENGHDAIDMAVQLERKQCLSILMKHCSNAGHRNGDNGDFEDETTLCEAGFKSGTLGDATINSSHLCSMMSELTMLPSSSPPGSSDSDDEDSQSNTHLSAVLPQRVAALMRHPSSCRTEHSVGDFGSRASREGSERQQALARDAESARQRQHTTMYCPAGSDDRMSNRSTTDSFYTCASGEDDRFLNHGLRAVSDDLHADGPVRSKHQHLWISESMLSSDDLPCAELTSDDSSLHVCSLAEPPAFRDRYAIRCHYFPPLESDQDPCITPSGRKTSPRRKVDVDGSHPSVARDRVGACLQKAQYGSKPSDVDEETVPRNSRASSHCSIFSNESSETSVEVTDEIRRLGDAELRDRLLEAGECPGPILPTTRGIYLKHLAKLSLSPRGVHTRDHPELSKFSAELEGVLNGRDLLDGIEVWENAVATDFDRPGPWREGISKNAFAYLLIDPRITGNLTDRARTMDDLEAFRIFLSAVFYIGKGKKARPYQHLIEAAKGSKANSKTCCIQSIWNDGYGVVSLHVFHNVIPAEAYTREACMVDAIGLQNLTNIKKCDYYGVASTWSASRRRRLGAYWLRKAFRIFLLEGERQLRLSNVCCK